MTAAGGGGGTDGTTVVPLGGDCRAGITDRTLGPAGAKLSGNLAGHVDDEPRAVAANRERLRSVVRAERLVFVRQVHGDRVHVVPEPAERGVLALDTAADALVTASSGTALAVVVADCLPILLADPAAGVIGAAHAGRPGLVAGVIPATIRAMVDLGAAPDRLVALVGPGICGRCYEVPADMRADVAARLPGAATTTRWDTPGLDLRAAALRQLLDAGVTTLRDDRCTLESAELFSHRRDGRERPTGRFAGWVVRP